MNGVGVNAARGARFARACLVAALATVLVSACGHSRVVRRDYDAPRPPPRATRTPPRPAAESIPRGGVHVVSRGETLYGISFRYGLRYQDVAAWNGIGDPYVIEVGQRLRLRPGGTPVASVPPRAPVRPATRPVTPPPQPARPVAGVPSAPVATAPMPASPILTPSVSSPALASPVAWHWPTRGQLVGRFVAGDPTRQGIDIAGSAGQDVAAAGDGVVVYSGAGLVGYGELIIVKHNDEWLSAYAHNRVRRVEEGTRVRAGQVIAEMGRSGAARDMLHFEIRRNGKPVDPMRYLPAR